MLIHSRLIVFATLHVYFLIPVTDSKNQTFDQIRPGVMEELQLGWALISATVPSLKSFIENLGQGSWGRNFDRKNATGQGYSNTESFALETFGGGTIMVRNQVVVGRILEPRSNRNLVSSIPEFSIRQTGGYNASNAQLQATQGSGQAKEQQMKAHISVLQGEIELVKVKINELRRDMREVEAQKDSLKADIRRLGVRTVLDSSIENPSKKRYHQG
ncbi:hypothetical protein ACEPPN_018915 [Leptodophora sp. 'Broadleaf-Isolate-01']